MRILITGYTGYLGSNLYKFLRKKNNEIVKFNLRKLKEIDEITIFQELEKTKKIKVIINCAASLRPKNRNDFLINEALPFFFEKYAKKNGIKFIHISTINVLYKNRLDKYSQSKKKGETQLRKKHSSIIRLPLIYSRKGNKMLNQGELKKIFKYLNSIYLPVYPFIYPGSIYKPIEVKEVCKLLNKNIYKKNNRIINFHGKKIYNSFDLFKLICEQKQKKYLKINISWINKIFPKIFANYFYKYQLFQQIMCLDNTKN